LRDQIPQRVLDLSRLPFIHEAARKTVDQSVAFFRGFEQDRAAIGTRLRLIESRDEGLLEEVREENSLWYRVGAQADASVIEKALFCSTGFTTRRCLCFSRNRPLHE
jgi:hypothetical protein